MKTLYSLQTLRAIAAWLVVYHHYMQRYYDFQYSTEVGHFFSQVGHFGVDIFFVISGFIMYHTLKRGAYTPKEFLLRRLLRIVPVYWFMTLVFVVVIAIFESAPGSPYRWNISSMALSLLFIPHQNPSGLGQFPLLTVGWTLNYEIFFYLWLSLMLLRRRAWFLAATMSMLVLPLIWNPDWPYASILSSNLLYEFVFGMIVGYLYLREDALAQWKSLTIGLVFLLVGIFLYWSNAHGRPIFNLANIAFFWRLGNLTPHLSAVMFVCAALAFERPISAFRALRVLRHLGDMSYSTYLVHPVCLSILAFFFARPVSVGQELLLLAAYTAMTLGLSHLSFRWIETGPPMDFLKRFLLTPSATLSTLRA
jgi:exopolysaccharide production protein ExoZ